MMMLARTATQSVARQVRGNSTISGTIFYRCSYHAQISKTALICPAEKINWTYEELWAQVMTVAGGLTKAGYGPGSIVATDLDHTSQALLLQMAVAHNGMQILTVKNEEEYKKFSSMVGAQGSVPSSDKSFLTGPSVAELAKSGGKPGEPATDRNFDLAYYSSGSLTGNRQIYLHGVGIAGLLKIKPGEQVCVAASLNSSFGMGSVISAIVRSATVVLPDPASPELGDCTVVLADEEGLKKLNTKSKGALRDGLIKTGAYDGALGIPTITGFSEVAGVSVHNLGPDGKHALFDACGDTYFPLRCSPKMEMYQ
jgi:hypothetical protein